MSPLANSYLTEAELSRPEAFYPLHAYVCAACLLVQVPAVATPEQLFGDYAYFSSYSESWLRHARDYTGAMLERLRLGPGSLVVELASNDGYLLRYFAERGVPVLGVEPAANVARVAQQQGIETLVRFFDVETACELVEAGRAADLVVANNVLAHVPDLNGFVAGIRILLKPDGVATLEFPHLFRLMEQVEFDTIYHEHFSYFSLLAVEQVFTGHGLVLFDVDELPTHGGSLRIHVRHAGTAEPSARVDRVRELERSAGLDELATYDAFADHVRATKRAVLRFLIEAKDAGKSIAGYGAAAKGNTLLNYCGIGTDFLDYVADRSPHKQGRFLPGTHIPVRDPGLIAASPPDYLLILPWNLADEIAAQLAPLRELGCRFVVPLPEPRFLP
jgi:SAM-dependent methyltransferase